MAKGKAIDLIARRAPSFARLSLAFLLAIAFTLQCYVVQTHIHAGSVSITAGFLTDHTTSTKTGKSNPAQDDTSSCLFCQEMLYAGHYVMPAAVVAALPAQTVSIAILRVVVPHFVGAIAQGWQGRAPPRF